MKTKDGKNVETRSQVVGLDKSGRPVAGEILEIDGKGNRVLISPSLQHPTWVSAENLFSAPELNEETQSQNPRTAESEPAPVKAPEGQ